MKITIEGINVVLGRKKILNNINCVLEPHIYGLMGANGSGKTTFIRTILDLYTPKNGLISILDDNKKRSISSLDIGYLPQTFNVFKDLTVHDQLKYFCVLKNIGTTFIDDEIEKVLRYTNLMDQKQMKCKKLSGGMIRRLGIAQALIGNPQLLILDEPTAGLDPNERFKFKEMIKNLKIDIPIILSTHIVEDISSLCSHLIFLDKGELKYQGDVTELLERLGRYTYTCSKISINEIKEKFILSQEYEDIIKIIALEELSYSFLKKTKPTLEDAYLYLSQGERK